MNKTLTIVLLIFAALILIYPYLGISKGRDASENKYNETNYQPATQAIPDRPPLKSENADKHRLSDIEELLQN